MKKFIPFLFYAIGGIIGVLVGLLYIHSLNGKLTTYSSGMGHWSYVVYFMCLGALFFGLFSPSVASKKEEFLYFNDEA